MAEGSTGLDLISGTPEDGDEIVFYFEPTDIYQFYVSGAKGNWFMGIDFSIYDETGLTTLNSVLDLATRPSSITPTVFEKLQSDPRIVVVDDSGDYSAYSQAAVGDLVLGHDESTAANSTLSALVDMATGAKHAGVVSRGAEYIFDSVTEQDYSYKRSDDFILPPEDLALESFKGFSWSEHNSFIAVLRISSSAVSNTVASETTFAPSVIDDGPTGPDVTASINVASQAISATYAALTATTGSISGEDVRDAFRALLDYTLSTDASINSLYDDDNLPFWEAESQASVAIGALEPYDINYRDVIMYADVTIPDAPV